MNARNSRTARTTGDASNRVVAFALLNSLQEIAIKANADRDRLAKSGVRPIVLKGSK